MSLEFVVTINDVFQMRGELPQASSFIIGRYGNLDNGISAGARILPEWPALPAQLPARPIRPMPAPLAPATAVADPTLGDELWSNLVCDLHTA